MTYLSNSIRKMAGKIEYEALKQKYQSNLQALADKCKEYGINRDGDVFQVSCPVCKTKSVTPANCGFFVCKKKHVFSMYTEDGVTELTQETKVLGPDLTKDGKDAHGHGDYEVYKPDDKTPVFFSFWMHEENRDYQKNPYTVQDVSDSVWKFKSKFKEEDYIYLNYYAEVDTMKAGKPTADVGSNIKTWPVYINNMRWFNFLSMIEGTDWKLSTIHEGDR